MLTVVTHTRLDRPRLLDRCKQSVAAALPPGARHRVIHVPDHNGYAKARLDAALLDEYVALVDDDDTIDPLALSLCLEALETSGAGIACTNEVMVSLNGEVQRVCSQNKNYAGVSSHPRTLHHLCMFRSSCVDPKALDLHNKFGWGIDWFLKASTALSHGAIHVPMSGYFWTQHSDSMSKRENYNNYIFAARDVIRQTWPSRSGLIEQFDLTTARTEHKYTTQQEGLICV